MDQVKYQERIAKYREAMTRWNLHRQAHNCYEKYCPKEQRMWRKVQGYDKKLDKMEDKG